MPTEGASTLLLGGFPTLRIKDIDPQQDTLLKVEKIPPIVGQVLDTATWLGYTAIKAAKTAGHVVTKEGNSLQILSLCDIMKAYREDRKVQIH